MEQLELLDFQKQAVEFALVRKRSYLGLDPRLGKTPVAATIAHTLRSRDPDYFVVYICPPFLTRNTEEEFCRWSPNRIHIRYGSSDWNKRTAGQTWIVPDTMLEKVIPEISRLASQMNSILFVDEAHRFKNSQAQRTKSLFKLASSFRRIVYMSGTPMPNRPMELYTVLSHSAPETISRMNRFEFGRYYCAGVENQFGWDFSGASNMAELQRRVIGTFMLRIRREDVLDSIPPTEELILLDGELPRETLAFEKRMLDKHSPEDLVERLIKSSLDKTELHLATYRRELGMLKIEPALKYIKYLLEETDEKLVIFGVHTDVLVTLHGALLEYGSVLITGQTPMSVRHDYVKQFKEQDKCRVLLGNIQAAGIGLNFAKSNRVIFVEFSWVPAENKQAADRVFEMAKKSDIFIQYLVYKNSLDKVVLETNLRKRKVTGYI